MHADLHLAMTTLFRFDTPRNILLSLILLAIPLVAALGLRHRLRSAARVAPILTRLEWPLVLAFPPMFAAFFMPELSQALGAWSLLALFVLCTIVHVACMVWIKRRIFGTARLAKGMVCDACLYPQPASVASEGGRCPECGRTWTEGELPNRWQQAALYCRARWP